MKVAPETRVSVIGAGSCDEATAEAAYRLGRGIAQAGHVLVCGGLSGVMEAACRGAVQAGGKTMGILPGTDRIEANSYVTCPVATGLGPMRNFLVVANGDLAMAVEGGAGTLSEIGLALKSGRTVITLGRYSALDKVMAGMTDRVLPAADVDQALELMNRFFATR